MSMLPHLRTPHLRPPRRLARANGHVTAPVGPPTGHARRLRRLRRRPAPAGRCEPGVIEEVRRSGQGFVWLGLHDPDEAELADLAELFDLHPLAVEDAIYAAHQRPKLDRYEDMLFAVLKTVRYVAPESPAVDVEVVETGEISVFVGARLRHHRPPRRAARAAGAAPGAGAGPGAARARTVGGAARDHGPDRRRLRRRREQHAAGRRRGGDRRVRRARPVEAGRRADLRAQAGGAGAAPGGRAAGGAAAHAVGAAGAAGAPGDPGVLPRRRGPPVAGHRADRLVRRAAHHDHPGEPGRR